MNGRVESPSRRGVSGSRSLCSESGEATSPVFTSGWSKDLGGIRPIYRLLGTTRDPSQTSDMTRTETRVPLLNAPTDEEAYLREEGDTRLLL